jgi:hypothetical protein
VTPSGIETGRKFTGQRAVTASPTEPGAVERRAATFECNECNEAADAARARIGNARRLAFAAKHALENGDISRAKAALREVTEELTRGVDGDSSNSRPAERVP